MPLSDERIAELEQQCAAIEDEHLREALLKAMISDLEWKLGSEEQNTEKQPS